MRPILKITPEIMQAFPAYHALILYVIDLSNFNDEGRSLEYLRQAELELSVRQHIPLSEHPIVKGWRETFRKFGAKPHDGVCSYEALSKRVLSGKSLPDINPVVNLYNAISLKYEIPVGGEDWDNLSSELQLRFATGSELFITGHAPEEKFESPREGEVVWVDSSGVTCRRWNWRQCTRTQITNATKAAYFVFDGLPGQAGELLLEASKELINQLAVMNSKLSWEIEQVEFIPGKVGDFA